MNTSKYFKDPAAVLDYTWDWSEWLGEIDTITVHQVTADTGITVDSDTHTATTVTAWLSGGGVVGTHHDVVCQVMTADNRIDERTIRITIKER